MREVEAGRHEGAARKGKRAGKREGKRKESRDSGKVGERLTFPSHAGAGRRWRWRAARGRNR